MKQIFAGLLLLSSFSFASIATAATVSKKPSVELKVNGSSEFPVTIPYNSSAVISWTSKNTKPCRISGHTGTSGSFSTGDIRTPQIYSISCDGASTNERAKASALIKVSRKH